MEFNIPTVIATALGLIAGVWTAQKAGLHINTWQRKKHIKELRIGVSENVKFSICINDEEVLMGIDEAETLCKAITKAIAHMKEHEATIT